MTKKKEIEIEPTKTNANYEIFDSMLRFGSFENQKKKHFWVMAFDDQGFTLCIYLVGVGANSIRDYTITDILGIAIKAEATKIIIAQNYPNSKNRKPTKKDIDGTDWLYQAAQILGITLEDHIIIFN